MPAVVLLLRSLEQELQNLAGRQTAGQIVEGAVLPALSAGAMGFATGGEPLDIGSAQEVGRDGQLAQERGLALAQGQGGSASALVYLRQDVGEDNQPASKSNKKETACRVAVKSGKVCAIKTGMGLEDGNMQ